MPQHREKVSGGFITDPGEVQGGRVFVLDKAWDDSFSSVFARDDIIGIRISDASQQKDISFIKELPSLRYIDVYVWGVKDLSPIEAHPAVNHLGLECQFKNFDFSTLKQLKELLARWRPGMETAFNNLGLEYINIDGYPYENLNPLIKLENLYRLKIESKKLENLDGIDKITHLRDVSFVRCSKLSDVAAIRNLSDLKYVMFFSCKQVRDLSSFESMEKLERLHFENGSDVASVKDLSSCKNLRELYLIGMKVLDGDLAPLLSLPNLEKFAIAKSKHHSHTMQEINAALKNKNN